jgi:Fur family peroxide stress response transcriptional regulator
LKKGQQETILAAVCTTRTHPTADEIYLKLRKEDPHISLGTVYRNLNALAKNGDILRIVAPEGGDRFDFRLDKHEHMLCEKCGRVFDIKADISIDMDDTGAEISGYTLIFHGTCAKCKGE